MLKLHSQNFMPLNLGANNLEYMLLPLPPRSEELFVALNDIRLDEKGVHDTCRCTCAQVCKKNSNLINVGKCNVQHVTTILQIYGLLLFVWNLRLLLGTIKFMWWVKCELCGIETFNLCPKELISKKLVKWRSIGYDVVGHTLMAKRKKL
jgi:hypothetical protein